MTSSTLRTVSYSLAAVLLAAAAVRAQQAEIPVRLSPESHVRALDPIARRLLDAALACSPTVDNLVSGLESADLIVGIETRPPNRKRLGEFRLVVATSGVRYGRVSVGVPNQLDVLLSVLGHELQHASEVAGAAQVRDVASLRAFYLAEGYATRGDGFYETDAAQLVGRHVQKEVSDCHARR